MKDRPILLISSDPLLQALIGAWIEFEHPGQVQFPNAGESALHAVRRLGPAVIVVDMEHPDGFSEVFLRDMRARALPIVGFGREALPPLIMARAAAFSLEPVVMPEGLSKLRDRVASALH